jgi:hypothetical protein
MPFVVYKSQADKVSSNFIVVVEEYRQALLLHRLTPPARLAVPGRPAIPAIPPRPPTPAKGRFPAKSGSKGIPGRSALVPVPEVLGTPAPTAHPLVEHCIRRVPTEKGPDDYVADYIIVDD